MEDFCILKYTDNVLRNQFFNGLEINNLYDYKMLSKENYEYLIFYSRKKYTWYFRLNLLNPRINVIPEISLDLRSEINLRVKLGLSLFTIHPDLLEGIDYEILRR